MSLFLLVVGSRAPVRLLHKRPRKPSTTPQRWGKKGSFRCPSYAACWKVFSFIFGLDSESFSVQLTFADFERVLSHVL